MLPKLLALGSKRLDKSVRLLITHMEPGNEDAAMAEIPATEGFQVERGDGDRYSNTDNQPHGFLRKLLTKFPQSHLFL